MFDNNDFPNSNTQFAISQEALALLRWIVEYHSEDLKNIINHAFKQGLHDALFEEKNNSYGPHDATESIVDFFHLLELLLIETTDEHSLTQARENNLQPTIDQIDSAICDTNTVQLSIERATTELKDHPEMNARELLFKELLKRWTPQQQLLN